jgi:Cu2+-exporting ATPase
VQVAATSRLFRRGILVKAADGLERLSEVDTVVFDKTGTLSLGEPNFLGVGAGGQDVLRRAAEMAAVSRHPYARAVTRATELQGLKVRAASDVVEVPGSGLYRRRANGEDRLGSAAWCGVPTCESEDAPLWFRPAGGMPIPLLFDDALRPDAKAVIAELRRAGFAVELLSGDRLSAVKVAAEASGIEHYRARATPADKIARLDELKAAGRKVLMVGDGLNDAPALAAGHASLSPATAADISQTAADGIFQGDRLAPVVEALKVSRGSHRMALQNFWIAIGYNLVFVPLAMIGAVTPLIAAVAMSASSIAVTANAVRLSNKKLELRK